MTDISDVSVTSVTLQIFRIQTQIDPAGTAGSQKPIIHAVQIVLLGVVSVQQTSFTLRLTRYELSGDGGI